MFGKSRKRPFIEVTQLSSLVAEGVEITGDLVFTGGLRVDGRIVGNVIGRAVEGRGQPLLVLSDQGRIEGSVRCRDAVVNGAIVGDLDVEHFLELQSKARVTGTIRYQQLQMDVGAAVQGQLLQREGEGAVVATPPDTGNVVELGVDNKVAANR